MGFWEFCEKLSGVVGELNVIGHIQTVRGMWMRDMTVAQVAALLREPAPAPVMKKGQLVVCNCGGAEGPDNAVCPVHKC